MKLIYFKMAKQVFCLQDQSPSDVAFGRIINEIVTIPKGKTDIVDYPLIKWSYRWDGNKTAYSQAFRELIAINFWRN